MTPALPHYCSLILMMIREFDPCKAIPVALTVIYWKYNSTTQVEKNRYKKETCLLVSNSSQLLDNQCIVFFAFKVTSYKLINY